jgi:tRNA dimethylallyltransferase
MNDEHNSGLLKEGVIVIGGATASGKSALAEILAWKLKGVIINADSCQLYKKVEVITAQPTELEKKRVPHYLYGVVDQDEKTDARQYAGMVNELILKKKQEYSEVTPILVGGSGLYIKALTHGLDQLPASDPALRERLSQLSEQEKVNQLLELDPQAHFTVALQNPRYVERALEICLLTGMPQSVLKKNFQQVEPRCFGVNLICEKEALYHRINQRVIRMIENGALDEVREMIQTVPENAGVYHIIGVKELRAYIRGMISKEEAIFQMQQASRRYAKRQMTWFRRETWMESYCWNSDGKDDEEMQRVVEKIVNNYEKKYC